MPVRYGPKKEKRFKFNPYRESRLKILFDTEDEVKEHCSQGSDSEFFEEMEKYFILEVDQYFRSLLGQYYDDHIDSFMLSILTLFRAVTPDQFKIAVGDNIRVMETGLVRSLKKNR